MASNSFWAREKKRWKKGLEEASQSLSREIASEFKKDPRVDAEEFDRRKQALEWADALAKLSIDLLFREVPGLLEPLEGRPRWDRYLSSLRVLANRYTNGILFRMIFPLAHLDEFGGHLGSYLTAIAGCSHEAQQAFQVGGDFLQNWEKGCEIMRSFQMEPHDDLVALYASYKTWKREEALQQFRDTLSSFIPTAITLIVEGPLQLFFLLSEEQITIIFRLPIVDLLSALTGEEEDDRQVILDLAELYKHLRKIFMDSQVLEFYRELLKKTARNAMDLWYEEEETRRRQHPSYERRQKFVDAFESGFFKPTEES